MLTLKLVWYFFIDHWKWIVGGIAVLVAISLFFSYCGSRNAKLNQDEIIRAQQAIAKEDRKEMINVLTESDIREKAIDANLAEGRNATVNALIESRSKYAQMDNANLAAELEKRK